MFIKDGLDSGIIITREVSATGTYSVSLESAGKYVLIISDYLRAGTELEVPEAGDWIGGYGWIGSGSIEAANNINRLGSMFDSLVTIEVDGLETAEVIMRQIIAGNSEISGTVTWTAEVAGYLSVYLFNSASFNSDPLEAITYAVVSAETSKAYSFSGLENGIYYVSAILYLTDGQMMGTPRSGDHLGVYPTGNFVSSEMAPVTYSGAAIDNIDFNLNTTF